MRRFQWMEMGLNDNRPAKIEIAIRFATQTGSRKSRKTFAGLQSAKQKSR